MITAANYKFNDEAPVNAQVMDESDIIIGKDIWIRHGAVILPEADIGKGAIIGSGVVVRGGVEPYKIIASAASANVGQRLNSSFKDSQNTVESQSSRSLAIAMR